MDNYGIICFIALIILGLFAVLVKTTNTSISGMVSNTFGGNNAPEYVKYIFIAVIAGFILSPFYQIWKLSKRPRKIEELLSKIEAGAKATTVVDVKNYKITIPLIKVNFKLCPVTSAIIYLDNQVAPYQLPINSFYLADMKILLSGANVDKLNEIKRELYAEEDTDSGYSNNTEEPTPLKSTDEFRVFLDENLKDTIEKIDKQRSTTRTMTMIMLPLIVLGVFGVAGYFYYTNYKATSAGDYTGGISTSMIIYFFAGIIAIGFGYSYFLRWRAKKSAGTQTVSNGDMQAMAAGSSLNEVVFRKIIKFMNPTLEYIPIGHVGLAEFLESGLYQEKNYAIEGNDLISGRHNGVPFIACELWVSHKRNFSDEKESPDNVFSGQFFVAKFNKKFSSPVYVRPRKGGGDYTHTIGEKISLEDPEFMNMFEVYSPDQVEARYILTPTTMERIKNIAKRSKGKFYIAFNNNKITITNDSNETKFGVGFFDSLTKDDNKLLVDFYETIRDQLSMIDELKLNVRIWG